MFEDVKKQDSEQLVGDPKKVDDMFAPVDPIAAVPTSAVAAGKLTPAAAMPPMAPKVGPPDPLTDLAQLDEWSQKKPKRGKKMILILVVVLLLIGGAVFAYVYLSTPAAPSVAPTTNTTVTTNQAPPLDTTNQAHVNTNANVPPVIDADSDGLTDVEEQTLGTDAHNPDTDGDGLNDRDEVYVYKTNPLSSDTDNDGLDDRAEVFVWSTDPHNPDTDSDGYQDGAEVSSGYNPNGTGKIPPSPAL